MKSPRVSIIVPAYNQSNYLDDAIQSVLAQTFSDWELVIVDDGSTDSTAQVAQSLIDPRIKYIYQANKGLPGARNTGIRNSSGEYLAFLDADDYYLPEKLEIQVAHLDQNSSIGLSYALMIEVDQQGNCLRLNRSPLSVSLKDLVLGFPFSVNDFLIRREWVDRVGGFDESFYLHAEDRDFYLRLALSGCQFAGLEKFVSYRRVHANRIFRNLKPKLQTMIRALDTAFVDPCCPREVLALRNDAYEEVMLGWVYQEFAQGEIDLAQEHLCEVIRLNPSILSKQSTRFLDFMFWSSIRDGGDHEEPLRNSLTHLPSELSHISDFTEWAIGRGYLMRGLRDLMWGRSELSRINLMQAVNFQVNMDKVLLIAVAEQLLSYEVAFSSLAAQEAFDRLAPCIEGFGGRKSVRRLYGLMLINRAFRYYYNKKFGKVLKVVFKAILNDPSHLFNRGVISILIRSIAGNVHKLDLRKSNK